MIVETTKYVFGGSCIARGRTGKTLFVPFALPEETLDVEIVQEKKDYYEGRILDVLSPSPHRVIPRCKYFSLCGGCDLQMIKNEEQHHLREMSAKELMMRSHLILDFPIEFIAGSDWQYRNRFQFHMDNNKIGFLARKSHSVIHIEDCPIACQKMRKYLKTLPTFDDNGIRSDARIKRLHAFAYEDGLWLENREEEVRLDILERCFVFSPQSFFQSNVDMLKQLVSILREHVGSVERLLDFYSGVGTFSLLFANNARELHLVEWNKYSLAMASANLESVKTESEVKVFFHCLDSEKWRCTQEAGLAYDVAIVDPPRTGIDRVSLGWFCKKRVKKLLYVSCNPATFVRDASFLILNAGYRLQHCYFLDFYPQTHHLEVLGVFS